MKLKFLLCLIFFSGILKSQPSTFSPTHELEADPDLEKFVTLLKAAAVNKDIKFVATQLDKEVVSAFDGENNIDAFFANWRVKEDSTKFWLYLSRVLDMGGAYVHDPEDETGRYQVVFPYVYNCPLSLEDDPYAIGCIVGNKVNLRERPDLNAKVVTQLNFDIINFLYEDNGETSTGKNPTGDPEWYLIETYNKKYKGWVNWKFVYAVNGPRLFLFKNQAGKWRISSFVEGD